MFITCSLIAYLIMCESLEIGKKGVMKNTYKQSKQKEQEVMNNELT